MEIYTTTCISPIGNITLGSYGVVLVGLWIEGQKYFLGEYRDTENNDSLEITMPLAPSGTEFQQKVWK